MTAVKIEIVRFIDDHQPGFVEIALVDATGRLHTFVEKAPVVTTENLMSRSTYPCSGVIRCRVVDETFPDSMSRELVRISTDQPDGVESVEGETNFVVTRSQMSFESS